MAAVTINNQKFNVNGSLRDNFYNVTGNSGDTQVVGLFTVRQVSADPLVTAYSVASATPAVGFCTITYTLSAPGTFNVQVEGN